MTRQEAEADPFEDCCPHCGFCGDGHQVAPECTLCVEEREARRMSRSSLQEKADPWAIGTVHTYNFQSDMYGGRYRVIGMIARNELVVEDLEPSDEEIDKIMADPWGGEDEVLRRIDRAGTQSRMRLVSREAWGAMF
jgi:hypothetical protein